MCFHVFPMFFPAVAEAFPMNLHGVIPCRSELIARPTRPARAHGAGTRSGKVRDPQKVWRFQY
jgi:hypothetical protein